MSKEDARVLLPYDPASMSIGRGAPGDRRKEPRTRTNSSATCAIGSVVIAVDVHNVSSAGARVHIRQGVVPAVGEFVALGLMDREPVKALVVWTRSGIVGLQFLEPLADCLDLVSTEDMGSEHFRAILRLNRARE